MKELAHFRKDLIGFAVVFLVCRQVPFFENVLKLLEGAQHAGELLFLEGL